MPIYERRTRVRAPLDDVWAFHSQVDGLEALTPGWLGLRVDAVRGPDGTEEPPILESGSEIDLSVAPAGIGPRTQFRSVITGRDRNDANAWFRDEMVDGPFDYWNHTHTFRADGADTIVHDHVEYELPFGVLGSALGPLGRVGMAPMFRHRHRRTRALLERPEPNAFWRRTD
ncbi:SRPBCC family protein [Halobacteria archaeon AArc-dxtr1]|nr:SRPBCC family protein [Halobacteria archaeon AArc-dxtr1]